MPIRRWAARWCMALSVWFYERSRLLAHPVGSKVRVQEWTYTVVGFDYVSDAYVVLDDEDGARGTLSPHHFEEGR